MEAQITISELSKSYVKGKRILSNISLAVNQGEKIGIVGLNGAGKSTLLKILAGIIAPTSGKVHIFGNPIEEVTPEARQHIAYLSTENNLYQELTVEENLELYRRLYAASHKQKEKVSELFSLKGIYKKSVKQLSSGMKQKTAIACITMKQPEILILDEPTVTLDVEMRKQVLDYIGTISKDCTMIITSHNLTDIENVCETIYILREGSIIKKATVHEILDEANALQHKCVFTIEATDQIELNQYLAQFNPSQSEQGISFMVDNDDKKIVLNKLNEMGASIITIKNQIETLEKAIIKLLE